MKRILSLMLVAMLLVGCMSMVASATGSRSGSVTFNLGKLTSVGGNVSATNATITSISGIGHNGTKVGFADPNNANVSVSFTVNFTVADDFCGDVTITFSQDDARKTEYNEDDTVKGFKLVNVSGSQTANFAHSWSDWTENPAENCLSTGKKTRTCSICGDTQTEDMDIGPHAWGEWKETTPATCNEDGVETRVCSHDASHTETRPISKDTVEHTPDMSLGWQKDENGHWHICDVCHGKCDEGAHDNDLVDNKDGKTHQLICKDCKFDSGSEKHKYNVKKDGYYYCACGAKGSKIQGSTLPVPDMGDTTPYGTYNAIVFVIAMIAVFSVYALVSKRKSVK